MTVAAEPKLEPERSLVRGPYVLLILGTRPEAIKLAPLALALRESRIPFHSLVTGQHTDLFSQTGYRDRFPSTELGIENQNHPLTYADWAMDAILRWLRAPGRERPALIVVQGDTSSAMAGARAAHATALPLAHLEAGLRTFDIWDPWPEESFRVEIDRLSALRFAPTVTALGNLLAENLQEGSFETGNTVTDALRLAGVLPVEPHRRAKRLLVTLHRRESFGQPLRDILSAVCSVAGRFPHLEVLWPVHPNPEVLAAEREVSFAANVFRVDPLSYIDFAQLLAHSWAVLTDSGGVIEEAMTLGIPCAIARDKTERPEAVSTGHAILAGRSSSGVEDAVIRALGYELSAQPSTVYGDGFVAERAVGHIKSFVGGQQT